MLKKRPGSCLQFMLPCNTRKILTTSEEACQFTVSNPRRFWPGVPASWGRRDPRRAATLRVRRLGKTCARRPAMARDGIQQRQGWVNHFGLVGGSTRAEVPPNGPIEVIGFFVNHVRSRMATTLGPSLPPAPGQCGDSRRRRAFDHPRRQSISSPCGPRSETGRSMFRPEP